MISHDSIVLIAVICYLIVVSCLCYTCRDKCNQKQENHDEYAMV